ncbi:MAG: hypothetical protein AAFQ21_02190 [Pseudomonadota bacterium]
MRIPVFLSRPTRLNEAQDARFRDIEKILEELALEPRTLGSSDYPLDFPLKEVRAIAKHCAGGLILGFSQERASDVERLGKTSLPNRAYPTPWNHLEAGILFALGLPLLIWREDDIDGGVFDNGVTGTFVHAFDCEFSADNKGVRAVFSKWQSEVSRFYYDV